MKIWWQTGYLEEDLCQISADNKTNKVLPITLRKKESKGVEVDDNLLLLGREERKSVVQNWQHIIIVRMLSISPVLHHLIAG